MLIRHDSFSSAFVPARPVHVWLPDDYKQQPERQYSVLYMHDGQNLFNPETATGGQTWGVAEALAGLSAKGQVRPTLIVGIFNTPERLSEYLPQRPLANPLSAKLRERFGGDLPLPVRSDNYLSFVVEELKPFIDHTYRTHSAREETFMMGSSMGGLISLYALCEYPEVFAGAACLSTHWPAVEGIILPYLEEALPPPGRHKLYFDFGTATLDALYPPLQKPVDALLATKGYRQEVDWLTRRFEGAEHNETAWRTRVHLPLRFLLQ